MPPYVNVMCGRRGTTPWSGVQTRGNRRESRWRISREDEAAARTAFSVGLLEIWVKIDHFVLLLPIRRARLERHMAVIGAGASSSSACSTASRFCSTASAIDTSSGRSWRSMATGYPRAGIKTRAVTGGSDWRAHPQLSYPCDGRPKLASVRRSRPSSDVDGDFGLNSVCQDASRVFINSIDVRDEAGSSWRSGVRHRQV